MVATVCYTPSTTLILVFPEEVMFSFEFHFWFRSDIKHLLFCGVLLICLDMVCYTLCGPSYALSDYSSGWSSYHTDNMNDFPHLYGPSYVLSDNSSGCSSCYTDYKSDFLLICVDWDSKIYPTNFTKIYDFPVSCLIPYMRLLSKIKFHISSSPLTVTFYFYNIENILSNMVSHFIFITLKTLKLVSPL